MAFDLTKGACKFVIEKNILFHKIKTKAANLMYIFPKDVEFHVVILP